VRIETNSDIGGFYGLIQLACHPAGEGKPAVSCRVVAIHGE
jgi:hypothetical protein